MSFFKQYISRTKNQVSRVIDGEAVIIFREKGRCKTEKRKFVVLTPDATRIWKLLDKKIMVDDFIKRISKALEVDYKENRNEIKAYLFSLVKKGLVDVSTR